MFQRGGKIAWQPGFVNSYRRHAYLIAERGKVTNFVTLQIENYAGRETAKASGRSNS
jgi:hypothetical protein